MGFRVGSTVRNPPSLTLPVILEEQLIGYYV